MGWRNRFISQRFREWVLLIQRLRLDKDQDHLIRIILFRPSLSLLIDVQFKDQEIEVVILDQLQMELITKYYQINNCKYL
jgi:hypothetical protein